MFPHIFFEIIINFYCAGAKKCEKKYEIKIILLPKLQSLATPMMMFLEREMKYWREKHAVINNC